MGISPSHQVNAKEIDGGISGVVCKCKKVFLGSKCAANGNDGNQCNASNDCSEFDGNCH